MKNEYPRRSGSGILNILGMGFAIILTIGFLKNNGYELTRSGAVVEESEYSVTKMGLEEAVSQPEKTNDIVLESARSGDYDGRSYDNTDAYSSSSTKAKRAVRRVANASQWVEKFSSVAISQAVSRGIPAGLSLAVGLQKIERGVDILSWSDFVEKVVDPLAKTKQRAATNIAAITSNILLTVIFGWKGSTCWANMMKENYRKPSKNMPYRTWTSKFEWP